MIPFDPKGRRFTVAVDFDGTLVEHRFPEIGPALPGAVEGMRRLAGLGCYLVLHTCRFSTDDGHPEPMLAWLRENQVPFDTVWTAPGKPFAHRYIDDRGIFWKPDWRLIVEEVQRAMVEMVR